MVLLLLPILGWAQALNETKARAEQGHADAQYDLGEMYASGREVPQDFTEAAKWFLRAGEQGNANAQYSLGLIYGNGFGVSANDLEAYVWFSLAAEQGHAQSQSFQAVAGEGLNPEALEEAQKQIAEIRQKYHSD